MNSMERSLRSWFVDNGRSLPWRTARTPYRVWVSEIMLQQTQAATVIPYYRSFLRKYRSVKRLAESPREEVLRAWEGLGYYRRARQLHEAARRIRSDMSGRLPRNVAEWMALPGIGRYTAHAILSFAQGDRLPILEANTRRLYCRLLGLEGDPRSAMVERQLWSFAESILPRRRCADWNDALIDLGALCCVPTNPHCGDCPWRLHCRAAEQNIQHRCGRPVKRPAVTHCTEAALVIRSNDQLLLMQRGDTERWSGLWDFLRTPPEVAADALTGGISPAARRNIRKLLAHHALNARRIDYWTTIEYSVTRYRVTLHAIQIDAAGARAANGRSHSSRWVDRDELASLPLTRPARRLAKRAIEEFSMRTCSTVPPDDGGSIE